MLIGYFFSAFLGVTNAKVVRMVCESVWVTGKHLSECPTHCRVEAVGHEFALAIRGDERDGAVVFKA